MTNTKRVRYRSLKLWKLFFCFPKKEMDSLEEVRIFSSANPTCSLWFPITSHAGKTYST